MIIHFQPCNSANLQKIIENHLNVFIFIDNP